MQDIEDPKDVLAKSIIIIHIDQDVADPTVAAMIQLQDMQDPTDGPAEGILQFK